MTRALSRAAIAAVTLVAFSITACGSTPTADYVGANSPRTASGPQPPGSTSSGSASSTTTEKAAGSGVPTFGITPSASGGQLGYGEVKPKTIGSCGGSCTILIDAIRWESWGGTTAQGSGKIPDPADTTSSNADMATVTGRVVAYHLGTCDGHPTYLEADIYNPQKGETFTKHADPKVTCDSIKEDGISIASRE